MPCSASCWWTRSTLALSLSILLMATMMGTFAARAHRGECLVAGRVDEDHGVAVRRLDLVGADPLRDAAGLARGDARLADGVEDGRLAVVDVAEHGDDGGTGLELAGVLVGEREQFDPRGSDHVAVA